jgi:hypothetical protein
MIDTWLFPYPEQRGDAPDQYVVVLHNRTEQDTQEYDLTWWSVHPAAMMPLCRIARPCENTLPSQVRKPIQGQIEVLWCAPVHPAIET